MNGRPVVIRTLDLGADKMGHRPHWLSKSTTRFWDSVVSDLSLRNLDLFRPQLRAILRAADARRHSGDVPIDHNHRENCGKREMLLNVVAQDLERRRHSASIAEYSGWE